MLKHIDISRITKNMGAKNSIIPSEKGMTKISKLGKCKLHIIESSLQGPHNKYARLLHINYYK